MIRVGVQKVSTHIFTLFFLRDEGHTDGGECYVTFSACTVNLGNGFIPKSGVFSVITFLGWLTFANFTPNLSQCPEPGLYMFTLTVCTYDGKKCLLILRKNEKDVCALIDQVSSYNMTGGILLYL